MNDEPKIRPSDLEAEAHRLIETGQMPDLDSVLNSVAEARKKYQDKIFSARKHPGIDALKG